VLLVFYWKRNEIVRDLKVRHWLGILGVFLIPFTLYLYTYFMDKGPYEVNWLNLVGQHFHADMGGDAEGFDSFFERMRFQMFIGRFGPAFRGPAEFARGIYEWCRLTGAWEFPVLGVLVVMLGFVRLWRKNVRLSGFCLVVVLGYLVLAANIFRGMGVQKYSMPAYIILSFYMAEGFAWIAKSVSRKSKAFTLIPVVVALLLIALPILRYSVLSRGLVHDAAGPVRVSGRGPLPFVHLEASNDFGRTYGVEVERTVPPGSLILGHFSHANVLFYRKYAMGGLEGVDVHVFLPRKKYVLDLVNETKPAEVYFTFPPEPYGFEAEEVIPIVDKYKLYRVEVRQ
jgi:hypothetical protein